MKQLDHIKHLLYPVEKIESKILTPGFETTPGQEYAIVVNMGKGVKKIVNHCSKIYEVVPNRQVLEPLVKAFASNDIEIIGTSRFDSRFGFDIIFKDQILAMGPRDNIMPKLHINNSYDGRVKYAFILGFWRMICKNGMVIPLEGFEDHNINIKMRHTPAIGEYVDPELLVEMVEDFKTNTKLFIGPYKELAKKKVLSLEECIEEVIENTKFPSRRSEDVFDRVIEEMDELKVTKITNWLVYNGFNYQLNHSDDINMDSHKKEKLDQEVLTYLLAS